MATDYQALPATNVIAAPIAVRDTIRWSRVAALALLVPLVVAFGTPVFAFSLLLAVLVAPALVAAAAVFASRSAPGT
jgi:hypothetical protein